MTSSFQCLAATVCGICDAAVPQQASALIQRQLFAEWIGIQHIWKLHFAPNLTVWPVDAEVSKDRIGRKTMHHAEKKNQQTLTEKN